MADLSITAANVKWVSGVRPRTVQGGATITRGQALYADSADGNQHKKADANAAATSNAVAIALTDGTDSSDMLIAVAGSTINVGATTTAGVPYCVSSTDALTANGAAGGIVAYSALGAGDTPCILFWGSGTANVTLVCALSPAALA